METTHSPSEPPGGAGGGLPIIQLPDGGDLVAFGGDLEPRRLLDMYRRGIFPWYEEGSPVLWWSPDPRAILELDALHVPRRLRRTMRRGRFEVTFDRDFPAVIRSCAEVRRGETWITPEMIEAYCELHRLGFAHSVETWEGGQLAGGMYGIAIGRFFAGESMFYRVSDASKVALVRLVERLREGGCELLDLQILNEHTESLGGIEIRRRDYLRRLERAVAAPALAW